MINELAHRKVIILIYTESNLSNVSTYVGGDAEEM